MSFDEKFDALMAELNEDPKAKLAFQENPLTTLQAANIPLVQTMVAEPESLTLSAFARENPLPASVRENLGAMLDSVNLSSEPVLMAMEVSSNDEQPLVSMAMDTSSSDGEQIKINKYWWGYDIVMNEKLTEDIIEGLITTEALTGIIGGGLVAAGVVAGAVVGPIAAVIAGVVVLKIFEIKVVNNGKGVHWPVTWPQEVFILSQTGMLGPIGAIASVLTILHPFRN